MAEITHLEAHQTPPEDQDWILVERTPSGHYVTQSVSGAEKAVGVLLQGPFATYQDALGATQARATKTGIGDIYAKGVPSAERS
jgi:hypothetical protein